MQIRNLTIGALILSGVLLLIPSPGQAYSLKMTRKEPPQPQFWCRDIRIAIAANHHPDYSTGELVHAVEATIKQYSQFTPIRVSIIDTQAASENPTCSVDDGRCPNAWIGFPPNWDKHDAARAASTKRWFDANMGEVLSSTIELHPDKPFGVVDPANPTAINDLESTLMHEFGHLFGLGHSDNADACMWGGDFVRSEIKKRSIHFDDEDGMKALYTRERLEACGYLIPSGYVFAAEKVVSDVVASPMIRGSVRDSAGRGVAGVRILLTAKAVPGYKVEVISDLNGNYTAGGVADNTINFYATRQDYRDQAGEFSPGEDEGKGSTLVMQTLDEAYASMGVEKIGDHRSESVAVNLYNLAVDLYNRKEWAAAERLARKVVELEPGQDKAIDMLVWCNYKLSDWQDVLEYSQQVLDKDPGNQTVLQLNLLAAQASGNTTRVREIEGTMRPGDQVSVRGTFDRAVAAINLGDDSMATTLLQKAITIDPGFANAYLELGKIKIREFEFDEATEYLKKYIELDPGGRHVKEAEDLIVTLSE